MHEIRYYQAEDGWRWQLIAGNNLLIAESGEAYSTEGNCKQAIERIQAIAFSALPVVKAYERIMTNG